MTGGAVGRRCRRGIGVGAASPADVATCARCGRRGLFGRRSECPPGRQTSIVSGSSGFFSASPSALASAGAATMPSPDKAGRVGSGRDVRFGHTSGRAFRHRLFGRRRFGLPARIRLAATTTPMRSARFQLAFRARPALESQPLAASASCQPVWHLPLSLQPAFPVTLFRPPPAVWACGPCDSRASAGSRQSLRRRRR